MACKIIAIDINDTIRDNLYQFRKVYQKFIDPTFEIELEDISDYDFYNIFPFENRDAYNEFKYVDCPFELYARAECCDKNLLIKLNDWLNNTLRDFEEEDIPNVMYVSPMEMGLTIQSTLGFLNRICTRVREYYFPTDSLTIWDRCDILITANPKLIENCPENKTVLVVTTPYNKNIESNYRFKSLMDIINDENQTIIKLIENRNE